MNNSTSEIVESLQLIIKKLLEDGEGDEHKIKFEVRYWDGPAGSRNSYNCTSFNEARIKSFEMSEHFDNVHITDKAKNRVVMSLCCFK